MPRKLSLNKYCKNCKHMKDALTKHLKEQGFCICYLHNDRPVMQGYEHCTKWESKYKQPEQLKLL